MTMPIRIELLGLLGEALDANRRGRLSTFITDADSPAVALFSPSHSCCNDEGDWYGEHAGKWLSAASRAAARSGDAALRGQVLDVADHLLSLQRPDGYLGTYAPHRRFDVEPVPPVTDSWDGAPSQRTWDVWIHAYLIIGLIDVHRSFGTVRHLEAACRIGGLCHRVFVERGVDITALGNHFGLSATVLLDPAMELHRETGDPRYLALALRVLDCAEANPWLRLRSRLDEGVDPSAIGTGKAYQLLWNLVGLAKLAQATGDAGLQGAIERQWSAIRESHLTLGGGPWGGVAHRSREVFNAAGAFSPQAYVETCSILAWIQLNRVLLAHSGDTRYADEIERSAYNDLLGAMAPNGEDWCYYSFPNGRRVHTTYWRCCKSSGAMAIEELAAAAYTQDDDGDVSVNLFGAGSAAFEHAGVGRIEVAQQTRYPFDGQVALTVSPQRPRRFTLSLRIPGWVDGATLRINDSAWPAAIEAGRYLRIEREWQPDDVLSLDLPIPPRWHWRTLRNVQESRAPDGSPVAQEVLHYDHVAVTRGPLVYASALVDGYRTSETLVLDRDDAAAGLHVAPTDGDDGDAIELHSGRRPPLLLVPYYRAGGRRDGAWRLTWFGVAPADASSSSR